MDPARETQAQGRPRTATDATAVRLIQAEAALARVRALHVPEMGICLECWEECWDHPAYPCPTIRALDGEDAPPTSGDPTS